MLLLERYEGETLSRHDAERAQQVRGLLLLAVAALLFAVLRAGVGHVFTLGWWRLW
jgi:hypothetical protein